MIVDTVTPLRIRESPRGEYLAYPSGSEPRWLLPRDRSARGKGLGIYRPYTFKGGARKALLRFNVPAGVPVDVEDADALLDLLSASLGRSDLSLSWHVGRPGRYQSAVAQVTAPEGRVLAFAKVAASETATEALENEYRMLRLVGGLAGMGDAVPRVRLKDSWSSSTVLVTSPGPDLSGPTRFDRRHRDFLERLHGATVQTTPYRDSPTWARQNLIREELEKDLTASWKERYARAFRLLDEQLGGVELPFGVAHRDFTPWNTRSQSDGGIYVFDWEFATGGCLVSLDEFHFHFMTRLLLGGGHGRPWGARRAHWSTRDTDGLLYYAYLVDIGLFYHQMQSSPLEAERDMVLKRVAALLDTSGEWLKRTKL